MIAFETLFLGLVVGVQPVALVADAQVVAIELRLDGAAVARLAAPPWETSCDLGPEPHPHELLAIARDRVGAEVGRVRQWVNMPRPTAEAHLLLEHDAAGRVTGARLAWEHLESPPDHVRITLNGAALAVGDPHRFPLPPLDPTQVNVLSAELTFPERVTARADLAFGGDLGETTGTDLTAVPIVLEPGAPTPTREEVRGWFTVGGRPARVTAVEESAADVVMVVDRNVAPFWRLQRRLLQHSLARGAGFEEPALDGDRLELLFAVPRKTTGPRGQTRSLFPSSPPLALRPRHLLARLCNVTVPSPADGQQALAEAVAVAGVDAALGNRPRAVVLAFAGGADRSRWGPDAARRFLADLHVPLRVWVVDAIQRGTTDTTWGAATNAGSDPLMDRALVELRGELGRQRIVWLEGAHAPDLVALTAAARGVAIAR